MKELYICVDFDGTIVTHEYPEIGQPVPGAIETLKELIKKGHKIILHTMRSNMTLADATNYMKDKGVELFGVNENPTQKRWTDSPKAFGHIYIDDAALGCPLFHVKDSRPYVDWTKVKEELKQRGVL